MARFIFYLVVLITSVLYGQEDDKLKAKYAVDTFFEGFHKGDTTHMKSVMIGDNILQTTYTNKVGKVILITDKSENLLKSIASRTSNQKWDECLLNYNIQVDGIMANVWTTYEFWLNDTFSHCGVNNF